MAPNTTPSALRSTVAYLICVAMFPATYLFAALIVHAQHTTPGFFVPLPTGLPRMIFGIGFYFMLVWIAGFFISALPCVLLHLFAARFRIRNPLFYVVAGGLLGLLAVAAAVSLPEFQSNAVRLDTVHWYKVRLITVGCVAGLVYWIIAGRHFGKKVDTATAIQRREQPHSHVEGEQSDELRAKGERGMPVEHFYNRSLLPFLGQPVPDALVQIGTFIASKAPNMLVAHARFHLDHCENLSRRLGDIFYFAGMIETHLASNDDQYMASLLVQTLLIAYLGSVKSFLDAIAVCLNDIYDLNLQVPQQDLCRKPLLERLNDKDPIATDRYKVHAAFYESVRSWRNAAQHQTAPMVVVCGPTEARPGNPLGLKGAIRLVNAPGYKVEELMKNPSDAMWTDPNVFFGTWHKSIGDLLALICDDIMTHCPTSPTSGAPA